MKTFIAKSGLTPAQFAKKYDIPYNTVRQWAEGLRSAPEWLKKLFQAEQACKPLLTQSKTEGIFYEYYTDEGLKYRAFLPNEATKEQIDWFNSRQYKFIHGTDEPKLSKRKVYKYYEIEV